MTAKAAEIVALAARVEQATGDWEQTKELLWEAFYSVHGAKPPRVPGGSNELDAYLKISNPFFYLLEAGGLLDAAMTLVPEHHHTELAMQDRHSRRWKWCVRGGYGVRSEARANTPALALTAAALRALASQITDQPQQHGEG